MHEVGDLAGIASLRGAHNWQNAAAAFAVCRSLGLHGAAIQRAISSFPGLAHRMEEVRRIGKVLFINDSKATNADAAARSLGVTVWLMGSARPAERTQAPRAEESSGWAAEASAHAEAQADDPYEDEPPLPEAGDLVQHFAFGLCEVLMAADERLKIRDLKGPGRIREIRLGMLIVHGPTEKDGKKLFRLERKN